ncbi:MAG TPA: hypothetical protein VNH53_00770 [Sphingomicrobium sp.]|jgi:hypothetical protein|nr:hypothetical protein [Sphingomicrobium sp.]
MTTKALPDETIGKAKLRIVMDGPLYRGAVIRQGKTGQVFEDADLDRLRHRLREEAGKSDPHYWGYDGAIQRFRQFFPKGFQDKAYLQSERSYKVKAAKTLAATLPVEGALEASASDAAAIAKVVGLTNLLAHQHEQQQMRSLLSGPEGKEFVRAAAQFALGEAATALPKMNALSRAVGRISWPVATYLPFLWCPESQMFLKPEVTKDYAARVAHDFAQRYEADLTIEVYTSLLDLVVETEKNLTSLKPADRIDVQSFIWVVGKYGAEELPSDDELALRAGPPS